VFPKAKIIPQAMTPTALPSRPTMGLTSPVIRAIAGTAEMRVRIGGRNNAHENTRQLTLVADDPQNGHWAP
jgi:hypothetical protein